MSVRELLPQEHLTAEKIRSIAFAYPIQLEETEKRFQSEPQEPAWGFFTEDGKMAATIINNQFQMRFDGQDVAMGGIGGVASLPESRRGGHVRAIMATLLRASRERGEVFSTLFPFSHAFYHKFGYELCRTLATDELPIEDLKSFSADAPVRMLEESDSREALLHVYQAFTRDRNIAIARDLKQMQRRTRANPYAANDWVFAIGENPVRAYVCVKPDDAQKSLLRVRDYAFVDAAAMRDMFGFLRQMCEYKTLSISLPSDVRLEALVTNPYHVTRTTGVGYMARTVHVQNALTLMKKPADAHFTVRVTDDFLPENSGCYRVTATQVSRSDDAPDLCVDETTLTQLVLGYLDLHEASFKPDVEINGNADMLARTFVKKPLYLNDFY